MKMSLIILAAGMGSRYGGIKQLDHIGPSGETIMDYSIYDAIKAGFDKVVFVIRESFADDFQKIFVNKLKNKIKVELVYQEIDKVPEGIPFNPERTKPWGTAHAMLMAKKAINEPFAVINADDFYGRESFFIISDFLKQPRSSKELEFALCGYKLANTLSEHGSVSRGICSKDKDDFLKSVAEKKAISKDSDGNIFSHENNKKNLLNPEDTVSMNFWGFTPNIFPYTEQMFSSFLRENGQDLKSEIYIPNVADNLIKNNTAKVKILQSNAVWFGVTYAEDKKKVMENIRELIKNKVYPKHLW